MLNDTILSGFTKTYADKAYKHTTMLRHKGVLIAFAMTDQRRICYAVLDQSPEKAGSPLDVSLWPGGPTELAFPNEIAGVGFGIADQTLLPAYPNGSDTPVKPGTRLADRDRDLFRSTTARLTADAPFQVLTDGRYVYLFRQAIDAGHASQVFKQDKDGKAVLDKNGNPVPLVDATLLLDRFVLVGTKLERRLEVRFQRSRSKNRPASRKDSLGAKDLDGNDFFEPTQELKFVGNLTGGRFTVLLLPTQVAEVERWQIFAQNRHTGRLDAFNVERSADGLFNTRGSQVFAPTKEGHAESALKLENAGDHVALAKGVALGDAFTMESWIFPEKTQSTQPQVLLCGAKSGANAGGPSILIVAQTRIRVDFGGGQGDKYTSKSILTPNTWNHLAVTFDGAAFRFYIGGNLRDKIELAKNDEKPLPKPVLFFGATQNAFKGTLDEIRLWDRVRSSRELQTDMNQRLTGLEPGLAGYWRFDEAAGDKVFDQTDNGADGELKISDLEKAWITSDAPIGENAGVNRNTFQIVSRTPDGQLESREVVSGLTALLYFQQTDVPSGYDGQQKPLKQAGRVMLAFATKGSGMDDKNYIASLDFGVSASGKIAQAPDRLALGIVNPDPAKSSVNEQLEAVKTAEEQVRVLVEAVKKAEKKRAERQKEHDDLVAQLNGATATIHAVNTSNSAIVLEKGIGSVTYNELKNLDINDRVRSLEIPAPLQVTVFQHEINAGASQVFAFATAITVNLQNEITGLPFGTNWSEHVSGLVIAANPAFSEKIAKAQQRWTQAQNDLTAQKALLTDARASLATLQSVLRSGAEAEMPAVHLDASGLSVSGGLLGFAWTNNTPLLFDSATGSLALYFRGADDQFFAAYYTTLTEKAKYPLADKTGNQAVVCVARSNDLGMDKIMLEVSNSADDDTCTVKIAGLEMEETWTKVPRSPERFARVLNGEAGHYQNGKLVGYRERVGNGTFDKANNLLILNAPGATRPLEKGAALMLGTARLIVKEAVAQGAAQVPAAPAGAVPEHQNLPLYFMEYDYAANAGTTKVPADLFGGSLLLRAVSPVSLPGLANQRVTSGATLKSKWTAAAPGSTLLFDGTAIFARLTDNSQLKRFDSEDDITLEAWVRPLKVEEKSRIIQHKSVDRDYTLGLQKKDLNSALAFDGTDDFIDLGQGIAVGTPFTLEAWIYPEAADDGFHGFLGGGVNLMAGASRSPGLWIVEKTKVHGGFGDGTQWHSVITGAVLTTEEWNHVAATFDGVWYRIFVNGILALETKSFEGKIPKNEPIRLIGKVDNFFPGRIDDVRIWKRARTQADLLADMNRRLGGNETDLVGYWHFENGQARDYSRNFNDGILHGDPAPAVSPLPAYSVFAGVDGKFVQSKDIIPAGNWAHLAAVFQQNYGLKFNGINTFLNCGNDETLNIGTDLTIEAFLRPAHFSFGSSILRRDSDGKNSNKIPYSFDFDYAGHLVFSFEDRDGNPQTFTSSANAARDQSTRVAVTRKRESKTYKISDNETKTLGWYTIGLHIGNISESFIYAFDEATRLAVGELNKPSPDANIIRAGSDRAPEIGRSDGETYIGRNKFSFCFNGIISEVRVWNAARNAVDLGVDIGGGEEGLVSWWRFEEREGNRASDSNGQNHASLNGSIEWVKDPDLQRSGLTLYLNDNGTLKTENITGFAAAENQFALGALANATPAELFRGELEEVRIWKTPRTREQIEDNLFCRINGEYDLLIAYYTFDAEVGNKLTDNALRGNHLKVEGSPDYILSTAPVGDDAPVVRSALAGIRTPFSGFIDATPAVQEYADMQTDSRGELIGVFKRCYGFIQNNALNLLTGYKVGDLAVEWIGQVQFAPQLIGFIEGAPPVPSENLTQPSVEMIGDLDDYNEASTVEFAQAEEITYTYTASREQGHGLEIETALKFGLKSVSSVGGGLGVIAITSMEEANILIGLKAQFESMWSWSSEASVGTARTTGKTASLELRGRYTSPEESANEPFGWRRFVPENTGLALVQSETADVFALRLKHNNALISFTMRPNPDIPKDWNIIHFPINPRYVKQGVLDGKIGPKPDVDYPNALNYSNDVSYFKPVEAYSLKNRIQKEERVLETYYSQFDAQEKGRKAYLILPSESDFERTGQADLKNKMHRNLVNTYVWTADGGLFAETQQTMELQTETSAGSYEFTFKGGFDLGINFAISKAAAAFELSALYVGQHKLNITKSRESRTSFELNVVLDKVERDIYVRDNDKVVLLDNSDPKRPRPIKHPYKVDAYRFMSFYMEPDSDHFDLFFNKVVDPLWIEQSDDPAAQALREARQEGKKPPCWRIMHRVTYVSRILPPLDEAAPPSLEKALQTLDIESNYELIKQLEPYVSNKLGSFPEFTEAVRHTIRQNLPELQPHIEEIIRYMSQYFGIVDGQMPDSEQFGETTLTELAPNQPPIVNAGLDQIIGLDGASVAADLEAVVIDDRLEKAEAIFVTWEKVGGEGNVVFENQHAAKTKATFTKRGRYTLRCTASDGLLEAGDDVVVIVDEPPMISAGVDQEITPAGSLVSNFETLLAGIIPDNGLGDGDEGLSRITVNWSKSSLPGNVTFANKNELDTKATFDTRGHYLLKLTVSNGTFTVDDEVLIAVAARSTRQLEALYTFEENGGTTIRDVSAAGIPLDLVAADSSAIQWTGGGLKLIKPVLLATTGSATRLINAIKTSNEMTIEAWIVPAVQNADGLTRIVTLSGGATTRNFTLGRSGNNYHLGLRSTTTNNNASNKALAGGVVANKLVHLAGTRSSDGQVKIYLDGEEVANRVVSGNFSTWDGSFRLALGDETGTADGIGRAWLGEYHLVAIYSRALSAQEVLQNFRFDADANLPPIAYAGENQVIDWQNTALPKITAQLQGRVANDRPQETINAEWTQTGGPGSPNGVDIQNKNQPVTTAFFSQKGRYVLRFSANDGQLMISSQVAITVHRPPSVLLKTAAQNIALTGTAASADLIAEVPDTGWGDDMNPANIAYKWSLVSGPSALQINDSDQLDARATFSVRGLYHMQLEVGNGRLTTVVPFDVTVNQQPIVNAGIHQIATLPATGANPFIQLNLEGKVIDTGLGDTTAQLVFRWEPVRIPKNGKVEWGDATKLQTTAKFTGGGVYVLRLTAENPNNKELSASSELTITANRAPVVAIGPAPAPLLLLPGQGNVTARLDATVSDDGLPDPPGVVALKWSKVSGPSNMSIAPDNSDYSEALFTKKGKYVLQLEADDQAAKATDTVTIVVNTPPVVDAGAHQKVTVEGNSIEVQLKGVVTDKGFGDETPQSIVTTKWEKKSGPGNVAFANPNSVETSATLPRQKGVYIFLLTANNGLASTADTVTVVVNTPPVVEVDVFNADSSNPKKRQLSIRVPDSGLGNPQQDVLTFSWKKMTGQEPVLFQPDPANELETTVTFPKAGSYTLELTVGNGSAFVVKKLVGVTVG